MLNKDYIDDLQSSIYARTTNFLTQQLSSFTSTTMYCLSIEPFVGLQVGSSFSLLLAYRAVRPLWRRKSLVVPLSLLLICNASNNPLIKGISFLSSCDGNFKKCNIFQWCARKQLWNSFTKFLEQLPTKTMHHGLETYKGCALANIPARDISIKWFCSIEHKTLQQPRIKSAASKPWGRTKGK